jgi:hypothetical protein
LNDLLNTCAFVDAMEKDPHLSDGVDVVLLPSGLKRFRVESGEANVFSTKRR